MFLHFLVQPTAIKSIEKVSNQIYKEGSITIVEFVYAGRHILCILYCSIAFPFSYKLLCVPPVTHPFWGSNPDDPVSGGQNSSESIYCL